MTLMFGLNCLSNCSHFLPFLRCFMLLLQEAGTLQARIRRVQVPLGEAMRPSRLPASQLPHMWQLSEGQQYRDSNSRNWGIEHHLMITGVEELLLKLLSSD
uniref:Uncharacterized protein n=1 Tax=Anolis carolinensis TaxID=28377 RepID=H9GUI3_ANOCA